MTRRARRRPLTPAAVIAQIQRRHLRANIARYERDPAAVLHWDRAWVDPGGTIFGPGPYLKVPVTVNNEELVIRVYPTAEQRQRWAGRTQVTP